MHDTSCEFYLLKAFNKALILSFGVKTFPLVLRVYEDKFSREAALAVKRSSLARGRGLLTAARSLLSHITRNLKSKLIQFQTS